MNVGRQSAIANQQLLSSAISTSTGTLQMPSSAAIVLLRDNAPGVSAMRRGLAAVVLVFPLVSLSAADDRDTVLQNIESRRATYADVAKQIWAFAEVGYQEQKSSALLQQQLRGSGFTVRAGVADIPTAFVASFGSGKPVVAIIGEFDALPGLSQEPVARRSPVTPEGPGHGCGHNLLGTGALASAIAVKE